MISINKISYDFLPLPGAQGMQMFKFDFSVNDEKVENVEEATKEIFSKMSSDIEALDRKEEFDAALKGKLYTLFTFDNIDKLLNEVNNDLWKVFYTNMTKLSYDAQYTDAGGISSKMNAWPLGLYVKPEYFSGSEQFYQYFNLIFCEIEAEEPENYSPFALTEILQNSFTHIFCRCDTVEDFEKFKSTWLEKPELDIAKSRFNVLVPYENIKDISPLVMKEGLRLCISYPKEVGLTI